MTLKHEPQCGDTIYNACKEAVKMAVEANNMAKSFAAGITRNGSLMVRRIKLTRVVEL